MVKNLLFNNNGASKLGMLIGIVILFGIIGGVQTIPAHSKMGAVSDLLEQRIFNIYDEKQVITSQSDEHMSQIMHNITTKILKNSSVDLGNDGVNASWERIGDEVTISVAFTIANKLNLILFKKDYNLEYNKIKTIAVDTAEEQKREVDMAEHKRKSEEAAIEAEARNIEECERYAGEWKVGGQWGGGTCVITKYEFY